MVNFKVDVGRSWNKDSAKNGVFIYQGQVVNQCEGVLAVLDGEQISRIENIRCGLIHS